MSAAALTAAMQTFLRERGVAEEVADLFTAEVILENAVGEMKRRGLALDVPVPSIEDRATGQAERGTSPAPIPEIAAPEKKESASSAAESAADSSESPSPAPPTYPLVEATPLGNLVAGPKSVSRHPKEKYLNFFRDQPGWLEFFVCRFASSIATLHNLGRAQAAQRVGQFAIDWIGREPLFTGLEFYLAQPADSNQNAQTTIDEIKQSLFDVRENLRKHYTREQAEGLKKVLVKEGLWYDAPKAKAAKKGGIAKNTRARKGAKSAEKVVEEDDGDDE